MNKKVVFIGPCSICMSNNKTIDGILIDDIPANLFSWKIVRGLVQSDIEITVFNDLKTTYFPRGRFWIKEKKYKNNDIEFIDINKLNIFLLEKISKRCSIGRLLRKVKPDVIMVYSLHSPYLGATLSFAKKAKCSVISIVPDLPEFMFGRHSGILKMLKSFDIKRIQKLEEQVDGFIFLTKQMKERINNRQMRYIVIEGICDNFQIQKTQTCNYSFAHDYIFYSGSIDSCYGLPEFIDKFLSTDLNVDLVLCGMGDFEEKLHYLASQNEKIHFLGQISHDDALYLQKKASLLINPRNMNDEFTKFSFPSKTIEYLLSGTPLMMERLPGVPDEYFKYIIDPKGDWSSSLKWFFSLDKDKREDFGRKGKEYVMQQKSIDAQGRKMANFIEEIVCYNDNTK